MAVKNGITPQGSVPCPRDPSGSGDEPLHLNGAPAVDAAGRAEELRGTRPADETSRHTDSCCLHREAPGSAPSLADGQVCKSPGLGRSVSGNSLLSEPADAPLGKADCASSAAAPEIPTETIPGVGDDFSDDDLEYFECSDALTAQENEMWQQRLRFLLESDDDDLKLSVDCDGCARLLGRVSGDTAPLETPIGFRGHHSTFPGLAVRRDPSMSGQADMTLAGGHGGGGGPEDPAADEQPSSRGGTDARGHPAGKARHSDPDPAAAGAEPCAGGTGAAGTMTGAATARVAPEEGLGGDVLHQNHQHAGRAFTESLRRNLLKLLNPLELCRYVSTLGQSVSALGQSVQAAAQGRESAAPSPSQGGVLIPKETESLEVQAGEADEARQREGKMTRGPPEQNQMPDENVPLGDRGADLLNVTQNCENLRAEPEGTFRARERGGSSQPSAGMLPADITLPAGNADSDTPSLTRGERESCHQGIVNDGKQSEEEISAFPAGCVPDRQESPCAVLSSTKLGDEPREGQQSSGIDRWDSIDAALPCSPSGGADAQPAPGSAGRGDADGSAVRDKLRKLLHEDDSEGRIPFSDRRLELRPTDVQGAQRETCCHPPLLMDGVEEREPLPAPSPGRAECSDHPMTIRQAVACLARVAGADGAGNELEAPAVCPAAISTLPRPGLHPGHGMSWVNGSAPGEGCHFRGGPADCPEGKGVFPSDNSCQLTRAGHSSVNTVPGSDEVNLQAEGGHSDSNTQNHSNSQSCHLPEINSCQDFQVVSAAQKHGSEMQLPALTEPPETTTGKNLPQNAEQLPETAKQEGAITPSCRDLLLSDLCLEVASCESAKPGGDQSEIHTADEHRAGSCPAPGVAQVSESQSTLSPHYEAEAQGRGDGSDAQRLLTPASHPEGLIPSSSAVTCPGTGIRVKAGSTPAGDEGKGKLSVPETSCRASRGLLQGAPAETEGEGAWCEDEHGAAGCGPGEGGTEADSISCQAQGQPVNTGTEQCRADGIPPSQPDCSIQPSSKEEAVGAAESVVNCGSVHFPPADSGSKGRLEEQTPCGRTRPFPSTARDPFAIDAERGRNQEGSRPCQAEPEPPRGKQDAAKGGHSPAGAKKKLPPAALPKKPRLEEKGGGKKSGKGEAGATRREDRKPEQRKLVLKKDSKAPRLLRKIQAESFPEGSGNVRLCCQFGDIHGDSTVTWTKDSKLLARLQRSARDDSPVSLELAKATSKDQGMYYCCLNNSYGKVTAEFHLTAAVLERLSSSRSYEGVEEIEFMQLLFREDSISDSYFGGHLHGVLATEQLHFGEGMHRRAFRSRVRRGLAPVFAPGHSCVLKVHSALSPASGTREELVRRNYNLALQECCVQNAARLYAKLYAAEAETLEGFGEVPEIIPIFLIHRPANTIPYATVEEELVGEFVKYSVRDGREVNFLRRDSEAGQKCCTFQHWVYERTSGNLLVTDLQGVGMKLTDVGIATLAKGYKGFKGNCSFSFIEQFRALHQCNEYCEMLGLKSLRATHQKQRKKEKAPPLSAAGKKTMMPKKGREHRDFISSEH